MSHIIVIGAGKYTTWRTNLERNDSHVRKGVVGLSTALRIQELGHKVTILAEHLPGDKKNIEYTSPWAVSNIFRCELGGS